MSITTVKVSAKGQIAIPKQLRKEAGIKQGDELMLLQMNGRIILEKTKRIEKKLTDDFRDILKLNERALRSIWDNKEDDIWNAYLK